ncbi:MAG: lysylphosphatidylglycerol synthase transmembrane domain-containing protein [Pseudomonadota bacterium]
MLRRRHLWVLVGLLFSAVFTWAALHNTDAGAVTESLAGASGSWTLAFLAMLATFCVVKAIRWGQLLSNIEHANMRRLLPPVLIGYFGTAIMPMQLGEVFRAHSAARRLGMPFMTLLSSLAVERIFDVFGLVSLVAVLILYDSAAGDALWYAGMLMALGSLILLFVLVLAVTRPEKLHAFVRLCTGFAGDKLSDSITAHLDAALEGMAVLKQPSRFIRLLVLSIGQWILMWGCVWASLFAVDVTVSATAALAVLAAAVIGMMLPSGPAYIGTFQLAFVLTLAPFGVAKDEALAASLFYQIMLWVPLSIAGIFSLRKTDLEVGRMIATED